MRKTTLGSIAGGCAAAAVAITVAWQPPRQPVSAAAWTSAAARAGAPAVVRTVRVSGPDPFTGYAALPLDSGLPAGAVEPVAAVNPRDPANIAAAWRWPVGTAIVPAPDGGAGR